MTDRNPRIEPDLVQAVIAVLDAEMEEAQREGRADGGEPEMGHVLARLFGYSQAEADIAPIAVQRATLAAHVTSEEDLDARMPEVERAINGWLDGFAIGLRYASQPPKPKMEVFDL